MIDIKKVLTDRVDEIDAMTSPEQAALAAQQLWDTLQELRTLMTPLRVKTLRAVRDARTEAGAETPNGPSLRDLADFLGIKVTAANTLMRGGSSVLPRSRKKK